LFFSLRDLLSEVLKCVEALIFVFEKEAEVGSNFLPQELLSVLGRNSPKESPNKPMQEKQKMEERKKQQVKTKLSEIWEGNGIKLQLNNANTKVWCLSFLCSFEVEFVKKKDQNQEKFVKKKKNFLKKKKKKKKFSLRGVWFYLWKRRTLPFRVLLLRRNEDERKKQQHQQKCE
jgi:hypothetical protein